MLSDLYLTYTVVDLLFTYSKYIRDTRQCLLFPRVFGVRDTRRRSLRLPNYCNFTLYELLNIIMPFYVFIRHRILFRRIKFLFLTFKHRAKAIRSRYFRKVHYAVCLYRKNYVHH